MSQAERFPSDLDQRLPTLAALPGLNGRCWTALRWLNLDESATIADARRTLFELSGGEALHVHRVLRKQKGVGHHTADLLCKALGFVIPVRGSGLHCPTCTCAWKAH